MRRACALIYARSAYSHGGVVRVRKHAVETVEMLDFLKELVESVPDPSAGGTVALDADQADAPRKRRGKGKKTAEGGAAGAPRKRRKKGETKEEEGEEDEDEDGEALSGAEPKGGPSKKGADEEDDDWEG